MLELGIDCRLITGLGNGGGHAWNIVKLDGKYYNVDATWDASWYTTLGWYEYFLRCDANFGDHVRDAEYASVEFRTIYPMSDTDYDIGGVKHDYVATVTPPTCTEQGYTTYICSVCGSGYIHDFVDPTGHTPGEPVKENETATGYEQVVYCTACGEELSREPMDLLVPGDINGDGKLNNKDATRLFQYLSGWGVEVNEALLDVNGDGKVNNKGATRLFQYLSGWNVEIYA